MKGQSSMEFLAMVSMSLLVLSVLYGVMASKQADTFEDRFDRNAEAVANDVSFQTEMALVQGEGYSRVFNLPGGIGGDSYTVSFQNGLVVLESEDNRVVRSTRYPEELSFEVNESQRVFKVMHNETGVFIVEQ